MTTETSIILFDFDGVIVDSGEDMVNAVNYTLNEFGKDSLPRQVILSYIGNGSKALIRDSFGITDISCDIDKIHSCYIQYYLAHCAEKTVLFPHVKQSLLKMHEIGIKCVIVTNKPEALTYKIIDMLGISQEIDLIIGPESVKEMKPSPEGIRMALKKFNIHPRNGIMVGDSHTDILAGKAAKVRTCAVTYGMGNPEALFNTNPDYIIDSIDVLLEITCIDKMNYLG